MYIILIKQCVMCRIIALGFIPGSKGTWLGNVKNINAAVKC